MARKRGPGDQLTPGSASHSAPRAAPALQAEAAGVKVLMGAKL